MYKKVSESVVVFLVLYVDDILIIGNDFSELQFVKIWLSKNLSMKDLGEAVATPEPGLTQMASPNRNPRMLGLFLFIFRVIKFSFSKISRPESPARPEWQIRTGARFTQTFSFILSKHFIMSFRCGSGFSFGQAHNHLQIQCNSVGP